MVIGTREDKRVRKMKYDEKPKQEKRQGQKQGTKEARRKKEQRQQEKDKQGSQGQEIVGKKLSKQQQ